MTNNTVKQRHYNAIVVGAGPGGLATIVSLLDGGLTSILWVDRKFGGGRLNELYREISSNTKTGTYLDAVHSSPTCCHIVESASHPNAVDEMEQINREDTCQLSLAGDLVQLLVDGVIGMEGIEKCLGEVAEARLDDSTWHVQIDSQPTLTTPRLFLCTGSYPLTSDLHKPYNPNLTVLDLDHSMIKSTLPSLFPNDKPSVVAVIGNSHSGILCCRNLYEISQQEKDRRELKIFNFRRREIKFAEYREDGIVYDNTGLKGSTADWAKEHMLDNANDNDDDGVLRQIDLPTDAEGEAKVYGEYLPQCTHIIYAIGYSKSPYPKLFSATCGDVDGKNEKRRIDQEMEFDSHTSGFKLDGQSVKGLWGLGIAHPEVVDDPEGHTEAAVGMAKFFKFAERVKDSWVK
ncbi:hypothetical protein CI109_104992 [Kwoniella shandongensis]|uniref:Uncharacterized protein n=1 Tax=Kwoniella shandongensis TaxID=1734106 RepID=A0A5M6BQG0_9TREE|nr:uncharacterized protein CI109_006707 [Kwoniella shandongensis]KAA5524983.1 hypothetical protein CI109_006707 [Kwoniella shandongensis]